MIAIAVSAWPSVVASATAIRSDEWARWPSQSAAQDGAGADRRRQDREPAGAGVEHLVGKSRQQLGQRPAADADRDQQHEQRADARMRRGVADAVAHIGDEAARRRALSVSSGAIRMRASANMNTT